MSQASSVFVLGLLSFLLQPVGLGVAQFDVDSAGTVIIGGEHCQMIALDDGRFVALQDGALPKVPLEPKARVRIRAYHADPGGCTHALPVRVEELEHLPKLW